MASDPFDNPLEIEIGFYQGNKLASKGMMEVKPFGHAWANQKQYSFAECSCEFDVSEAKVLRIREIENDKKTPLSLDVIVPDEIFKPIDVVR